MKINGTTKRRHDWPLLLEVYIGQRRADPFEWGHNDCVQFALGWLECVREDLAPRDDLGELLDYKTATGAVRAMGNKPLAEFVDAWGELPRIGLNFAQRGDLVLIEVNGRASLGLCVGDTAVGPGVTGLEVVPMADAVAAWRV